MIDPRTGGKRIALLRVLIWTAILTSVILFWIVVGAGLFAWIS